MSKITETNQQYYQGSQGFRSTSAVAGALNNFKIYKSATGLPGTFAEYILAYTVINNTINITGAIGATDFIVVQLKRLDGGQYGTTPAEKAYGEATEENYGGYQYVKLNDIVNNFMVGYVGDGKAVQQ